MSLKIGRGAYPQLYPKPDVFEQLPKYKEGQKLVCCTEIFNFGGGDSYPFEKKFCLSALEVKNSKKDSPKHEVDMLKITNNEDKLLSFADPALWKF